MAWVLMFEPQPGEILYKYLTYLYDLLKSCCTSCYSSNFVMDRSLEMLVDVDLEEEGILRLLFAAVHLMFQKAGNDNDISAASR